tara:strand:+ start:7347 stop:7505 length:159 start_codon:yes stop_codon:yes gene_type:complete
LDTKDTKDTKIIKTNNKKVKMKNKKFSNADRFYLLNVLDLLVLPYFYLDILG